MNQNLWMALLGGALIGLSSAWLLLTNGRIAGISGIFGGVLSPHAKDFAWRVAFMLGMLASGSLIYWLPQRFDTAGMPPLPMVAVAGLLVGFGTRLGSGCTSGHGVCGISRGSPRSLLATLTFIASGAITVFITRHL